MSTLTPTARVAHHALPDGPGNAQAICERTGHRRSATGTALAELATAELARRVDGGDPADRAPTRWRPADNPPADGIEQSAAAEADQPDDSHDGDAGQEKQEPPKRCRGCHALMPATCPGCCQRTPSYCGTCRRDRPHTRRPEPQLLASGLPRLRPGELSQLVAQVMRDNPLPQHLGITGWTASRVAVYLPGRSAGVIAGVLDKLTHAGTAQRIGDQPSRYQLTPPAETADSADG